jgi:hypothetical protein
MEWRVVGDGKVTIDRTAEELIKESKKETSLTIWT